MNAIKIETTVDEPAARAFPALRPFVGKHVEMIVLETPGPPIKDLELEDLVPIKPAEGVGPVLLEDMARAIVEGAKKRARV